MRKGIILAGGTGTRLYPMTIAVSKQLLPVYDKPMIFYPLSTLMLADIRNILIITTPQDNTAFQRLLGDGTDYGININYAAQDKPSGIAQAIIIAGESGFIKGEASALILGDNLFYGQGFEDILLQASQITSGSTIFGYYVSNPESYGVIKYGSKGIVEDIIEKPQRYVSNYAVPGLYFYDKDAITLALTLSPSSRGELEITDLNKLYLNDNNLNVLQIPKGVAWLDTGTCDSLNDAAEFVRVIQKRQGQLIACLEQIAYNKGWITKQRLLDRIDKLGKSAYTHYLYNII